jgi:ERF superfamily
MDEKIESLMTPSIGKLAEALAKAQAEIKTALKDKNNPFFKSSYADLEAVWDACRDPLTKNGLSVTQPLYTDSNGKLFLVSLLLHSSGEWIKSVAPINPVKSDPQSTGSAITYMKRFALSALVGVVPSEKPSEHDEEGPKDFDDDGNAASGRNVPDRGVKQQLDRPTQTQMQDLFHLAKAAGLDTREKLKHWIITEFKKNTDFTLNSITQNEFKEMFIALKKMIQQGPKEQ